MSYKRPQRHRPDGNQSSLVDLFVKLGGHWMPYANKPFDGWAYHEHFGHMPVEIKDPKREGHANEYTERQVRLMLKMRERGIPWLVWRTDEDVLRSIGKRGLPRDFDVSGRH